MISSILKSNQPFAIVLIFIIGLLMWMGSFIEPISMAIPADYMSMPLYDFLFGYIHRNSLGSVIIAFIIVLLQAFALVQFNKRNIIINYRTYLPAFFYVLISGSFVQLQRLNPVMIGSAFIFLAVSYIYRTYREDYALNKLYLAGFFIALATLFWAPFAVFFLLIWISLTILRPVIGREWIVGILGFLTPFLFVFIYYFVFGREDRLTSIYQIFSENFRLFKNFNALHFSYYIFYGFILLIIVLSSYAMIKNFQMKKIKNRKYFEINWWLFLFGIVLFVIFKNVKYEIIYLLAIPVSFLFTDFFYTIKRNWYLNSILVLLFGMIAYIQIIAHYL